LSSRLAALGEALESPLLVTNLTNVYYLTGFDASNAALLVEPGGGAQLYTDFRYIEAARAIEGVEARQTKRAMMREGAGELSGRVPF
jgi:Xaa-Pro aminopeptidase